MATFVRMPKLSMTMEAGTVTTWTKTEGDPVQVGEVLLEIETDKAIHAVEAEAAGVLRRIYVAEGGEVPVNAVLAVIAEPDEPVPDVSPDTSAVMPGKETETCPDPLAMQHSTAQPRERLRISPLARKLAAQHGLDPASIRGTGPDGRIEKQDILTAVAQRRDAAAAPKGGDVIESIPLSGMRGAIARRVTASVREIPHIYFSVVCDATNLVRARERSLPTIEEDTGIRLTYNDMIVQLVAAALARHPRLNATLQNDVITVHRPINVGIVVNLDDGLVVPVLHDVADRSLRDIVRRRKVLVDNALNGRLTQREMDGGTFTISNLGNTGVDSFTAIINPPQVAILSVGSIVERAGVFNGQLVMHPMIHLVLGTDHRAVDGHAAAMFLATLRDYIEQPAAAMRV